MNLPRRQFLQSGLAASAAAALSAPALKAAAAPAATAREYYELRSYRLKPGASTAPLDGYLEKALIPALNKRGIMNVGVFTELTVTRAQGTPPTAVPKVDSPVWVLMAHPTFESFQQVSLDINNDPAVLEAGAAYLNVDRANAAFDRIDSSLLISFTSAPKMMIPPHCRDKTPGRFFEMRTYDSFSELKALKKVQMFNAGEVPIMQEVGLAPVFFGQTIAGRDLPNLTYITSSPEMATHFQHWTGFNNHPNWAKLRDDPQYANTVSKNTSRFLTATSSSQL
jgi:hypothetical protein